MVDRERGRERSLPVPRADLGQLVDAWRDALVHGQTAAVGAGGQIGELLIAPLGLEPGRRLIIDPPGALHYLTVHALRVDGPYMIQSQPIAIARLKSTALQTAVTAPGTGTAPVALGNTAGGAG